MKPMRDRACEGRANAKGIPCLYLATHEETAVAEVRPWVGAIVSLAQLKTTRVLRFINCTVDDPRNMIYFQEPSAEERERAVWGDVDRAFARPVEIDDDTANYAPTQVMAEAFREQGFDGVAYRSSLGPGHNIAVFDLDAARIASCSIVNVKTVQITISELTETYFVDADPQ
jgi:RES domain-containing protein